MRRIAVMILAACCLALAGQALAEAGPVRVVVSIAPQRWFVERIAGDRAEVAVMVPPGGSPHGFEPRPSGMRAVAAADLYLALGLGFERVWLPKFQGVNPGMAVARVDAGIDKSARHEHDHEAEAGHEPQDGHEADRHAEHMDADHAEDHGGHHHGGEDPHVWLSPELAKTVARNTRDALAQADPAGAAAYEAGLAALVADIEALQRELAGRFAQLKRRAFMVYHPSWGWFAHEFGLRQLAVEQGGHEPGPGEMARLVAEARRLGVRTVFVQPQASKRAARALALELGGGVAEADPLAGDWAANLRAVAERFQRAMQE